MDLIFKFNRVMKIKYWVFILVFTCILGLSCDSML